MTQNDNDESEMQNRSDEQQTPSAYDRTYGIGDSENQVFDQEQPANESSEDESDFYDQFKTRQPFPGATWSVQSNPPCGEMRRSRAWIVGLVAVILCFVLLFFGVASCSSAINNFSLGSVGGLGASSEETNPDALTGDSIGVIALDGTISYDGSLCSPEGFKEQLDTAADNSHIKAIVLRVDSGGGTAAASEEMVAYLQDFKKRTGKPVVVSSASINASAAYMISSQADYIYTLEATSIGAIGTALQFTDLSGFYELLGIEIENIISTNSKDATYGTRPLTDDEREYYQAMVDQINNEFIETVAQGRNMTFDEVQQLATGLSFTGADAVDNGLADELGTLEDAIAKAEQLADISSSEVVYLQQNSNEIYDILDLFGTSGETDLETILGELQNNAGLKE